MIILYYYGFFSWLTECLGDVSNPKIINLFDGESGSIYWPNNASAYGSNENCNWLFNATRVLIYFTFMDFEDCCTCDYVEIFDGPSDVYNSLMKGCNTSFPRPVYSSGRYLFMKFKSDWSIQGRGFVAHYKALSQSSGWLITIIMYCRLSWITLIFLFREIRVVVLILSAFAKLIGKVSVT